MWRVSAPHLWLGFEDYSDRNHAVCSKLCNVWQLLEEPPVITTAANLEKLKLGAGQSTDGNYFLDFCMILFRLPWTFFFCGLDHSPRFSKCFLDLLCVFWLLTRKLLQLTNAQLIALEELLGCTVRRVDARGCDATWSLREHPRNNLD